MTTLSYISPKATVRDSPIHGRGLFAVEPRTKGDIVAVKGGYMYDRALHDILQPQLGPADIPMGHHGRRGLRDAVPLRCSQLPKSDHRARLEAQGFAEEVSGRHVLVFTAEEQAGICMNMAQRANGTRQQARPAFTKHDDDPISMTSMAG
jgi:hypothetical protein